MKGFEDLLPTELAGRRGPAPMRPGGSPPRMPAPAATATHGAAVEPVDGVPDATVDAWFATADADGDGRVADSEARDFFLTSGLAPADLSKIWKLVKSPEVIAREGKGLSRHRFAQVLRLIALAQSSSFPFTQENATAALQRHTWMAQHGVPLPPPRLAAAGGEGGVGVAQQQGAAAAAAAETVDNSGRAAQQTAVPAPSAQQQEAAGTAGAAAPGSVDALFGDSLLGSDAAAAPAAVDEDDDLFGLRSLQRRHGAPANSGAAGGAADAAAAAAEQAEGAATDEGAGDGLVRRLSRSLAVSHRSSRKGGLVRIATGEREPPVAFVARLPPLQPKVSAKLTLLAAGNGSLFAGPAVNGGLLQWGRPEGNLRRPMDVEGDGPQGQPGGHRLNRLMSDLMFTYTTEQHVGTEDSDAAPAIEVAATEKGRTTACLLVDEPAQLLWVADKDGWVYAYDIGGEPGLSLRAGHRVYAFQAHRVGHVTTMVRTPQGELWTGSSRGYIRVWELGEPALVGEAPAPPRCRELRKGYGERPHNGTVLALACPADGQVVWSASHKGLLLWDAACGAFLGALQRGPTRGGGGGGAYSPDLVPTSSGAVDNPALRYKVDAAKGLEVDPLTGYVVARPPSGDWPRIAADQEGWAAQTDNNINELMERVSIGGSKVVQGAGKAVKLLGKLLGGGGGDKGAQDLPSVPSTARSASYGSMALPSAAAAMLPDDDASLAGERERSEGSVGAIVALLAPLDGSVWVAHASGTVDRYTPAGRRLGTEECGANITAAACVGCRVWLGFSDGMLSVRGPDGASLRLFQAHSTGILSIAQAGSRTYSLAADGSIKGWSSAVPHAADEDTLVAWDEEAVQTFRRESLRILAVTWNVGESKPEPGSPFFRWVHEAAFPTQLVVVGLQEIEMGSSSVALAAAKDAFSQRMQERGNTNAKFWSAGLLEALGGDRHWHQVGLRQLSGMLVLVFARNHLRDEIGEVTTASVACGVLGVGGNKGAVAVEFSVHRRKIAVVCSHFAAHQGAVEARNANYATICRQLTFISRAWFEDEAVLPPAPAPRGKLGMPAIVAPSDATDAASDDGDSSSVGAGELAAPPSPTGPAAEEVAVGEGMRGAQMLVWLGDFNYRIDGAYEAVKERAIRNELGQLLELDQCRREMAAGRVFRGLREGPITFRPTYKFDKASANPFGYDTSEKRRIPAWCDRIFFRGSQPFPTFEPQEGETTAAPVHEEDDVTVAPIEYNCWADVTDSDHKPVYAVLEANLPITDQAKKRAICAHLLKRCAATALGRQVDEEGRAQGEVAPPAVSLQPDHVKLHQEAMPRQMVLLRNDGPHPLLFRVTHDLQPAGLGGELRRLSDDDETAAAAAQQLLEVRPVRGVVPPGQDVQLQVHISGDEWALRGALHNPRLRYRVHLGSELSTGGESTDPCAAELTFSAECLTRL